MHTQVEARSICPPQHPVGVVALKLGQFAEQLRLEREDCRMIGHCDPKNNCLAGGYNHVRLASIDNNKGA